MTSNRSIISPLRIDAVTVPGTGGLIGMTICPGKDEYAGLGIPAGPWKRDLDLDLQVIRDRQAQALVTLIEDFEFELLSVPELPDKVREFGIRWLHLPIVDVWVPDKMFEEEWETAGEDSAGQDWLPPDCSLSSERPRKRLFDGSGPPGDDSGEGTGGVCSAWCLADAGLICSYPILPYLN